MLRRTHAVETAVVGGVGDGVGHGTEAENAGRQGGPLQQRQSEVGAGEEFVTLAAGAAEGERKEAVAPGAEAENRRRHERGNGASELEHERIAVRRHAPGATGEVAGKGGGVEGEFVRREVQQACAGGRDGPGIRSKLVEVCNRAGRSAGGQRDEADCEGTTRAGLEIEIADDGDAVAAGGVGRIDFIEQARAAVPGLAARRECANGAVDGARAAERCAEYNRSHCRRCCSGDTGRGRSSSP